MAFVDTRIHPDDLPAGEARLAPLGDLQLGLFHTEAGFFAIDDTCPHKGAPLHEGTVAEGAVTCPWHQWHFGLDDGLCRNIPGARVAAYAVEARNGTLWIDVGEQGAASS